jgi:hypothetical protein
MGFEIFIYILRWVTKLIGKICDLPPVHPSSYFMTSPLELGSGHMAVNLITNVKIALEGFNVTRQLCWLIAVSPSLDS